MRYMPSQGANGRDRIGRERGGGSVEPANYGSAKMRDLMGREYARMSRLHAGDKVQADGDFTCIAAGSVVEVHEGSGGDLYVPCNDEGHYLDGQLMSNADSLVGLYHVS
jgi:hypothetical protein